MTPIAAIILLGISALIVIAAVLIALWAARRTTRRPNRDDTARAGASDTIDSHAAALRAGGSTAWMRPGGGGF